MLRDNKELTVGVYFDQGSDDLQDNTKIILGKNFKQVIDLYGVLFNLSGLIKYKWLLFTPISFLYFYRLMRFGDPRVKRLFWDGKRQDHRLYGICLGGHIKTFYFVIRQLGKLARFIYLITGRKIDVIAFPDEVYGGILLSYYCFEKQYYILTNFTDYRYSFSINTYSSGASFRFSDRYTLPNTQGNFDTQEKMGQSYIDEIFAGRASHKDYAKAYSTKPQFKLDNTVQSTETRTNVLVAIHNVTDAPSTLDMAFENFEEWYFHVRDELRDERCVVYVKDHPTANSREHIKFIEKVNTDLPSNFVFIPRNYQVDLCDFDVILSCDGSIFYEASVKNVAGISFANGNSESLSTVTNYNPQTPLFQQVLKKRDSSFDLKQDKIAIYNWHVRQDLKRFNVHQHVTIPDLSTLKSNTSYRSIYSLENHKVIFEENVECNL